MQMILYQTILGGISLIDTNAMKRGRILEPKVLEQVAAKTGLILEKNWSSFERILSDICRIS